MDLDIEKMQADYEKFKALTGKTGKRAKQLNALIDKLGFCCTNAVCVIAGRGVLSGTALLWRMLMATERSVIGRFGRTKSGASGGQRASVRVDSQISRWLCPKEEP